jgi:hypothetical protein
MLYVRVKEVIQKIGDKWVLMTKDGKKKLGEFDSEEAAKKREAQINAFKHMSKKSGK